MRDTETWIEWSRQCPQCGNSVWVNTNCPQTREEADATGNPPFAYDGDPWKCPSGHTGIISCDGESPAYLQESWHG
jgi:hypothetical protein